MASSLSRLTPLQRDLLEAFFTVERRFVLTGGSALGGFHLGHRESHDLDLFTRPPVDLDAGEHALLDAARECGATIRTEVRHPEFRRFLVERGEETTLVDLVVDRAPQADAEAVNFGAIRVDSVREIAANKIGAILSRAEIRDIVDLRELLATGVDLEDALRDAELKDPGVNPATLAWLLNDLQIADDAPIPGNVTTAELKSFLGELIARLRALAFPDGAEA